MKIHKHLHLCALIIIASIISGCATMDSSSGDTTSSPSSAVAQNEPYFPTSFSDFEVPGELKIDRKKTMYINTSSFTGGIIHFSGRVEVNSLTDYFINSMEKNGWKRTGEVRYQNILLAFTKPNKNCMISISEGNLGSRTQVDVYITEVLSGNLQ